MAEKSRADATGPCHRLPDPGDAIHRLAEEIGRALGAALAKEDQPQWSSNPERPLGRESTLPPGE
jgi:hypothetical protein